MLSQFFFYAAAAAVVVVLQIVKRMSLNRFVPCVGKIKSNKMNCITKTNVFIYFFLWCVRPYSLKDLCQNDVCGLVYAKISHIILN